MWRGGTRRGLRDGCLVLMRRRLCGLSRNSGYEAQWLPGGKAGRPGRFGKLAPHLDFLVDIVRAEPDITLKELAATLSETEDVQVQLSSRHRALDRAGLSYDRH